MINCLLSPKKTTTLTMAIPDESSAFPDESSLAFSEIPLSELSPKMLVPSDAEYIKSSRSYEIEGKLVFLVFYVTFLCNYPQPPTTQFVDGRVFLFNRYTRCTYTNVVTYKYSMVGVNEMLTFCSIDTKPGKVTLCSSPEENMSRIIDRLDG